MAAVPRLSIALELTLRAVAHVRAALFDRVVTETITVAPARPEPTPTPVIQAARTDEQAALVLSIEIFRPHQSGPTRFRFDGAWNAEADSSDVPTTGDIALVWSNAAGAADAGIVANDLARDDGLQTAVLLSLFTDRAAEEGDVLPDEETDRRGWWGDEFADDAGDRIGSRLWLLARSKRTDDVLARAEEYARESLQWLIDDKVAERIEVTASAQ